jgi:CubicO group peptidase (beta-lactamase class C family)
MLGKRLAALAIPLLLATPGAVSPRHGPPGDDLDRFVRDQMARRHIPGLSLAIIEDGKLLSARAYGVTALDGRPVTPATLFLAGSVSKSVSAAGALHLVEAGRLSLDADVNTILRSWKVPGNRFTSEKPVTLGGILSHTAGLTVHGFGGYAVDEPMPTLQQVLDGAPPANSPPIRVDTIPGALWRYSGGGYTIMQQMILDATGRPFPEFMQATVLGPFGMTRSTFEQPLPHDRAGATATGYYDDRRAVAGRWHVYPEMAAAGLWTTPGDLARFAIGIQRTLSGKVHAVLSPEMARRMITEVRDGDGLGFFLEGSGSALFFGHNGRDEGFDALLTASAETGQGIAIMINANDDSRLMNRIAEFVARKYKWPNATAEYRPAAPPVAAAPGLLRAVEGRYEFRNNQILTLVADDRGVATLVGGYPDEPFVPAGGDRFVSTERDAGFVAQRDSAGEVIGLTWSANGGERAIPRLGPPIALLRRGQSPDSATTARMVAVLRAIAQGGEAIQQIPGVTQGARADFAGGYASPIGRVQSLSLLGSEIVAGRGIERHGGQVAAISYYQVPEDAGGHYVMIYLTADNDVTDFDLIEE